MKYAVQIIDNFSIHDLAKKNYPNLYKEVMDHDGYSVSSWYELTKLAYKEYKNFRYMMHRKKLWEPIRRLRPAQWKE